MRGIDQSVVKIGEKFFVSRKLALIRQILKISRSRIGRMLVARRPYDIGQLACGSPVDDLSHSAHVFGDFNGNFGILFLESGQIAEQGTFEELMEQKGKYAEMFHSQAKYYAGSTYGEAEEHE